MPLPLGVALIIIGLIFLYMNKLKKAKLVLLLSIAWFFLFSYPPLVNSLLYAIESNYPTLHQAPKEVRYIYVLGGGHTSDENLPITSQIRSSSVVRLCEAIRLYHQLHQNVKIIVSGFGGPDDTPHAVMQKKLALALGVKNDHIIVRPEPKDTEEEALAAKKLLGEQSFILVTSASHITRAMHVFIKEGLHPIPAPTNHIATRKNFSTSDVFSFYALMKSRIVFHEAFGILWQKIKDI